MICIFLQLRDRWNALILEDAMELEAWKDEDTMREYQSSKPEGEIVLDVSKWHTKLTLDVIGLGESSMYSQR